MIPIIPADFPSNIDQNQPHEVTFDAVGGRYKRTGYCNRCGECCDDIENGFAELDGNGLPNPLVQVVPGKCAYFRWGDDGLAICTGQDTVYYQNGCRWQPFKQATLDLYPSCSYSIEKISDGG